MATYEVRGWGADGIGTGCADSTAEGCAGASFSITGGCTGVGLSATGACIGAEVLRVAVCSASGASTMGACIDAGAPAARGLTGGSLCFPDGCRNEEVGLSLSVDKVLYRGVEPENWVNWEGLTLAYTSSCSSCVNIFLHPAGEVRIG
jgi:hypothetical protein